MNRQVILQHLTITLFLLIQLPNYSSANIKSLNTTNTKLAFHSIATCIE
jgi:hypothetical protein